MAANGIRYRESMMPAIRMRVDEPDPSWRPPFTEHAYLRGTTVGGLQWFYCLRHRGWEPTDG